MEITNCEPSADALTSHHSAASTDKFKSCNKPKSVQVFSENKVTEQNASKSSVKIEKRDNESKNG